MTPIVRLKNWLISLDQFVLSTITLGASSPDETISAAAWRTEKKGRFIGKLIRLIFDFVFSPFEKEHCRNAYLSELNKLQLPEEYRSSNEI